MRATTHRSEPIPAPQGNCHEHFAMEKAAANSFFCFTSLYAASLNQCTQIVDRFGGIDGMRGWIVVGRDECRGSPRKARPSLKQTEKFVRLLCYRRIGVGLGQTLKFGVCHEVKEFRRSARFAA